jgi:hypothetical protein
MANKLAVSLDFSSYIDIIKKATVQFCSLIALYENKKAILINKNFKRVG